MSHRVVIVGGGAGGLELATRLGRTLGKRGKARITLVDANLTHIWKPLLHEVAAGSLNSSADELNYVAQAKWNHFEFQMGRMAGLDRASKCIRLEATRDEFGVELVPSRALNYDTLVIAVGSTTNDFGTSGASEHCIFLDTREQAERFHRQLLSHYMKAHAGEGASSNISMAIVGAGATGVELAAELLHAAKELAAYGLDGIKPEDVNITLIEAGPKVLPALPERISQPVHQTLLDLGVTVLTGAAVSEVTAEGLHTKQGEFVQASLKVWAAGIKAPAFLHELDGLETNRINQLVVHPTLQSTRDENIFAFGDCAAATYDQAWAPIRDACERFGRDPASLSQGATVAVNFTNGEYPIVPTSTPFSGSIEQIADRFAEYAARGVEHMSTIPHPWNEDGLDRLAAVIDCLRA